MVPDSLDSLSQSLLNSSEREGAPQPYPDSNRMTEIRFSHQILRDPSGTGSVSGDQWAVTWSADGTLYTGWGDGTGFGYRGRWRDRWSTYMGLAAVSGDPEVAVTGRNVWGGYEPLSQEGALYHNVDPKPEDLKPSHGLIAVGDRLFWYASEKRAADGSAASRNCVLLSSSNGGRTWQDHGYIFEVGGPFSYVGVVQHGRGQQAAPDGYVYLYDGGTEDEDNPHFHRTDLLLARVPVKQLAERGAYEFFAGSAEHPAWTTDISTAVPVFHDDNGVNWLVHAVYNPGADRYLLVTKNSINTDERISGPSIDSRGFGIFEGLAPWGPWHTVYYTNRVGQEIPGLDLVISLTLTPKWMSPKGDRMWIVYSGRPSRPHYSFNLIRADVTIRD